jgi:hypothetical protein
MTNTVNHLMNIHLAVTAANVYGSVAVLWQANVFHLPTDLGGSPDVTDFLMVIYGVKTSS